MHKLGIVGCGMAGTSFAVAARYQENWEPVAAVGITAQETDAFSGKFGLESMTLDELAGAPEVEVVAVATPPGVHADSAVPCLEAGKHVIVEKPLSVTLDDCDRMLAAARANGRLLMTGHTYRYFAISRRVREIIDSGEFGRLLMIEVSESMDYFTAKRTGWQLDPRMSGGGVVMNPCIHLTDAVRFFANSEVISVKAAMGAAKPGFEIEGHVQVFYSFEDKDFSAGLTLEAYGHRDHHVVTLYFETAILSDETFENKITIYRDKQVYRTEEPLPPPYGENDLIYGYVSELENMAKAIDEGEPLLCDGQIGRRSAAVNLAIMESARTGKLVEID